METVIRTAVASSLSYALFAGLQDLTLLAQIIVPQSAYEVLPNINVAHMFYACILGILSGVLGLLGFLCLAVGGVAGKKVSSIFNKIGDKVHLPTDFLGRLMTPIVGGALIGLLAVACPLTLGSGQKQLGAMNWGLNPCSPPCLQRFVPLASRWALALSVDKSFQCFYLGRVLVQLHTFTYPKYLLWWQCRAAW
jgi:hypothetical protein